MENFTIGNEIFLTTHKAMALPSFFEITNQSEKAIQLKNSNNQTIWLPKSIIKWDEKFRSFFISDWFRKKMQINQLSILQS